jgi:succinate dehydrogenase/fumarate reductase flavoprotein subunit
LKICWRWQKELRGMPAGRHSHKIREYKRRIDALLEEERERRKPPPPPISEEHAEMRDRIQRRIGAALDLVPEGMDLEEAIAQSDELANAGAEIVVLMREEQTFLASQGVDPRPYERY